MRLGESSKNQVGDAELLEVGHLFGNSVVTHHTLREAGALREYLVIYGHLESAAPGLQHGQSLDRRSLLGLRRRLRQPRRGASTSGGVRRAREGVNAGQLPLGQVSKQNGSHHDPRSDALLLR